MKRSEMLCALDKRFPTLHMECNLEELLAFLEEQGMLPPSAVFMVDWDRWDPDRQEWYPSKERIHSHKWEPEDEE